MKRLSKAQQSEQSEIVDELRTAEQALSDALNHANEWINSFVGDAEAYYEGRSDAWREGERGAEYDGWLNSMREAVDATEPDVREVADLIEAISAAPGE